MAKTLLRLAFAAFIGFDVFLLGYISMIQLRLALFGTGQIPGGGSAVDMAFFLIPLFIGYVVGDRVFAFLRKRRAG